MANSTTYTDKEILQDTLMAQKHITDAYNTYAGECCNEKLRTAMLDILKEDHCIQADIFSMLQSNGWYEVQPAEAKMITQTKQKVTSSN
ncbi:MAG: spore coat protein [Oscillospiraceae bacterium]|jgi:spore coat protein CotF|nr:spore coat protein [Oscillospiraceae bacterium]